MNIATWSTLLITAFLMQLTVGSERQPTIHSQVTNQQALQSTSATLHSVIPAVPSTPASNRPRIQTPPIERRQPIPPHPPRVNSRTPASEATIIWERYEVVVSAVQTFALVVTFIVMIYVGIRQLRAYISVTCNFIRSFDDKTLASAKFRIRNCGATPAHMVRTVAAVSVFDYPLPESFHFPPITNQPGPSFALFPAQDMRGESWANRPFTQAEIDELRAGKKRIYIYGTARYRDVFRCNRHTNFSASVRADSDTLIKLTSSYIPEDLQVTFEACAQFGTAT